MKEVNEIHNRHNLKGTILGEKQFGKNNLIPHLLYLESWHFRMFNFHTMWFKCSTFSVTHLKMMIHCCTISFAKWQ